MTYIYMVEWDLEDMDYEHNYLKSAEFPSYEEASDWGVKCIDEGHEICISRWEINK